MGNQVPSNGSAGGVGGGGPGRSGHQQGVPPQGGGGAHHGHYGGPDPGHHHHYTGGPGIGGGTPNKQYHPQHPHHPGGMMGGGPGGGTSPYSPYMNAAPDGTMREHNRTSSDTSMSNVDDATMNKSTNSSNANHSNASNNNPNLQQMDLASLTAADDDTVPTVFRWEHGGRQVYITGTFNGWSRQIPMHRSGNDFTYIHNLKRGKHAFKFIVDDEWRFAPDQPTVADIEGRINNFIDVTDFKAYTGDKDFEREKAAAEYGCYYSSGAGNQDGPDGNAGPGGTNTGDNNSDNNESSSKDDVNKAATSSAAAAADLPHHMKPDPDGEVFSHTMPDLDEYTKEPPPLPPHLRHIILNKPPQLQDTAALPVPQHVALNHLYCTAIRDNMMVLGITQRFRTKFVTTVYYSPCTN